MKDINALRTYERCGHSAIMGTIHRPWQDCDTILGYFGKRRKRGTEKYDQFVEEGVKAGRRPDLVGGGLIRSLGGWSQVLSIKRAGSKIFSDERILGSSDFVKNVIRDAEEKERETLRLNSKLSGLEILADRICDGEGIEKIELCSGIRRGEVVKCRKIFCQIAVKKMGYCGADVARFLGITTSGVNRLAASDVLLDTEKYH